jgi:hypothetical protein
MQNIKIIVVILFTVFISSCKSTKIVSSWSEPEKEVKISNLNKVLVVALFQNETSRRKAEDQMVGYLKGKGVVSYNYLNENFNKNNQEAIQALIRADNFDAAITMRLIDVDKEQVYVPSNTMLNSPVYYRNFSGYYYRNYPFYYQNGYYANTKTYTVETIVFSIIQDKIIWSGLTKTTNPEGLSKMTEEISKVIFKKMVKQGFVNKN